MWDAHRQRTSPRNFLEMTADRGSAKREIPTRRVLSDRRAERPRFRFHDLRHSAASLLIASGVELAEVSMLLGHSKLRVTMDFYAHLQKQTAARAAQTMDALLRR